jgi:hypothetical protein
MIIPQELVALVQDWKVRSQKVSPEDGERGVEYQDGYGEGLWRAARELEIFIRDKEGDADDCRSTVESG